MAKQKGFIKNTSSDGETDALGKKSKKEIGKDIGGTPDEWDKKNIEFLIETYRRAFPNRLEAMGQDVRVETALSDRTKDFGEISKDSEMRVAFWMPEDLQEVLEAGYPSLWVNRKHTVWFLKNFPEFRRAEKV